MTIRVEEIRRMEEALLADQKYIDEMTAYDKKLLAALQEQTRWRRWPEEKPEEGSAVMVVSSTLPWAADFSPYNGTDYWNADGGDSECKEGDLWQPITMPEGR